jgi:methylmalonyl-CoA mutase cobalamin-binding subunit
MLRATEVTDPAPANILATTLGPWHDVGALIVALTAGKNGWHPLYQGPNLPAEDIAAGAKQGGVRAVAVSVSHLLTHHPLIEELRKLRRYLDRDVTIFVGGRAVAGCAQILEEIRENIFLISNNLAENCMQ